MSVYGPEDPDDLAESNRKTIDRFVASCEWWPTKSPDTVLLSPWLYNLLVGNFNSRLRPLYAHSPLTASRRQRRRVRRAERALTLQTRSGKFSG